MWQHYRFQAEEHILEVGCGTGAFWDARTTHLPPDAHVTLSDFSPEMIAKSRRNLSKRMFRFTVADVEHLSFIGDAFDHLLCHFMLYHASSQEVALHEMRRVLKPDGRLGVITVSARHMARLWKVAQEIDSSVYREYRMSDPFCEENAEPLLAKYVAIEEQDVYEDTLQIDNAGIVIGYLQSIFASELNPPGEEFYRKYADYVKREIAERGAFRIFKRNVFYRCKV